jgi:hypothetical protein
MFCQLVFGAPSNVSAVSNVNDDLQMSAGNSSSTDNDSSFFESFSHFLAVYYRAFIILFGLVGNSLTVVVFWRTKLTHSKRTSYYLIRLAISDICFLLMLSIRYFSELKEESFFYVSLYRTNNYVCILTTYVSYIFTFISCVFVMAFTGQRMCVICFPLRVNDFNVERLFKILVWASFVFAVGFYTPVLYFYGSTVQADNSSECLPRSPEFIRYSEVFNMLDSLFTFIVPFFGMIIMNTMMIRTLRNSSYNFILRTSSKSRAFKSLIYSDHHLTVFLTF